MADTGASATPRAIDCAAIPLALYVHMPWCVKKCPYCDFNSHRLRGTMPDQAYLDALLADLKTAAPADENRPISSIFFGGGTPSLFPPQAFERIIDAAAGQYGLTPDCEITMEANPGAAEHSQFSACRTAGINRISLGVQSLDDGCLKRLGRVHDAAAALHAIDAVQAAGFERMNCDLMFGLPGQTPALAAADVAGIIDRAPGHISYYQLTLEPGTPFHHRPPPRPDDDATIDIFERNATRLRAAGLQQYEVSAWAQPDHTCAHNRNYWQFGDYLAVGAGAHAKITLADGAILRSSRQAGPNAYMQTAGTAAAIAETRLLAAADRRFEFLLNGLRLQAGVSRDHYEQRTGLDWATLTATLAPAISAGLVAADADTIRATTHGWYYLDTILSEVLPDA